MMQSDRGNQFAPGKLWSLLEMIEFKLKPFHEAILGIASAQMAVTRYDSTIQEEVEERLLKSALDRLRPELPNLQVGGSSLIQAFERLEKANVVGGNKKILRDYLNHFQRVLNDELTGNFALILSYTDRKLYDQVEPLFGEDVEKVFQDASEDIAEAGKCLALGRSTAAVFHIMRALEVAVRVVADKIGAAVVDADGRGLGWGVIAKNMKDKIDQMPKGSEEQIEWYRVQSHLEVVNRAWRVPTAHPKHTYTEEEAATVFSSARSFMRNLAALA